MPRDDAHTASRLSSRLGQHKQSTDQVSEEITEYQEGPDSETHHLVQKYPATPSMSGEYQAAVAVERPELPKEKGVPRGWLTTAQQLKHSTSWTYLARCWDVLVTLLPVLFLGEYHSQSCSYNPAICAIRSCLNNLFILS